jgi:thiol-disulfide isomerase/thioredoxin
MGAMPRWALLAALAWFASTGAASASSGSALPEFTQTDAQAWINSAPLTVSQLSGHVVLLHVWAFECWNCYRSFPWLHALEEKYRSRGLVVVGIHTPELPEESDTTKLAAKTKEFGITHAVMIDNDSAYWRALDNHYWPAWYIVDAHGAIRKLVIGEAHDGDQRARAVESAIDALLAENAPPS